MNIRRWIIAIVLTIAAVSAFALSKELEEWGKGPAQFLMTKEEAAKWKTMASDDEAKRFVALFWARRDPTPTTPRNEFREEFELRVKQADANFASDKVRGALTDRGKTLILYGMPKRIQRTGDQRAGAAPSGISTDPANTPIQDNSETLIWSYEEDQARTFFNQPRAQIRFVDRFGKNDFRVERGGVDLAAAQRRAIARAITQPNLTEPPAFGAPQQAQAAPAVEAAPVVQTELTTDAFKNAVAQLKGSGKSDNRAFIATGEFVTAEGETFVPVSVYVPKSSGITPKEGQTFFGVIEDANGKSVLAFEEPAKLTASRDDYFVDKSITLPAGKHRGYFGIAENGTPVVVTAVDMELKGTLDKDATAASQLILSNNVYPLTEAQMATDPFAFGGLKVVPKADKTFRPADELWYFVELRNPGLPEMIPTADAPAPLPNIQVKLDVEGTETGGKKVKRPAPPMEIEAIPLKGVPGHYGVGNAIPLSSFKPGEYTFTVKIIDTIKKESYTLSEKFKVVE